MKSDLNRDVSKNTYTDCKWVYDKVLSVTSHKGDANQNHTEVLFTPDGMTMITNKYHSERVFLHTAGRNVNS